NLGPRSYEIAIGGGDRVLAALVTKCRPKLSGAFVVGDDNSAPHANAAADKLMAAKIHVRAETVPAGENTKRLEMASALYDLLAAWPADRQTLVVAVGGGVVGDLAGFVAATYNRGLPLLMI